MAKTPCSTQKPFTRLLLLNRRVPLGLWLEYQNCCLLFLDARDTDIKMVELWHPERCSSAGSRCDLRNEFVVIRIVLLIDEDEACGEFSSARDINPFVPAIVIHAIHSALGRKAGNLLP